MISYITGKIVDLESGKCTIVPNSGVGYEINVNLITQTELSFGDEVSLYLYHNITENSQSLYGFLKKEEKQLFLELIKISGIGGRTALNILELGISNILKSFANDDKSFIANAKGIGKKTAEKIFLDLKDKDFIKNNQIQITESDTNLYENKQIKLTLISLGYDNNAIDETLKKVPKEMTEVGDIINFVIRNI